VQLEMDGKLNESKAVNAKIKLKKELYKRKMDLMKNKESEKE